MGVIYGSFDKHERVCYGFFPSLPPLYLSYSRQGRIFFKFGKNFNALSFTNETNIAHSMQWT